MKLIQIQWIFTELLDGGCGVSEELLGASGGLHGRSNVVPTTPRPFIGFSSAPPHPDRYAVLHTGVPLDPPTRNDSNPFGISHTQRPKCAGRPDWPRSALPRLGPAQTSQAWPGQSNAGTSPVWPSPAQPTPGPAKPGKDTQKSLQESQGPQVS